MCIQDSLYNFSFREYCRFTGMEGVKSQPLTLAFQKLNLAAIHERGKWPNNIFSASMD